MRQRFVTHHKNSFCRNIIVSIVVFFVVFFLFQYAISSLSRQTEKEKLQTLEAAITRDITQCYAVEGSYPPSLEYLKKNYGLHYDENRYFVDYQPLGTNILPEVTIIRRGGAR